MNSPVGRLPSALWSGWGGQSYRCLPP